MSKPKKVNGTEAIIVPTMHFEGDKEHVMEALFKGEPDEKPILKSVGYTRLDALKGQACYVSYVITSQGEKILKVEVEQPDTKFITEESSKIAFVNEFMKGEM